MVPGYQGLMGICNTPPPPHNMDKNGGKRNKLWRRIFTGQVVFSVGKYIWRVLYNDGSTEN